MPEPAVIRALTPIDTPAAIALSSAAGWNQTADDWLLLMNLEPEGCLALDYEGKLVATTTLICHGEKLAWLGMVLTEVGYRGRGFARMLVSRALRIAKGRGILTVKLDATELGLPLYSSLGFREEQPIQRWRLTCINRPADSACDGGSPEFELDREAFGADRSRTLKWLAARGVAADGSDGFALWRTGTRASYLGPCVARTQTSARRLIQSCLFQREPNSRWLWDLLPANREATALAVDFGFQLNRELIRMSLGPDVRGKESLMYAAGGFELG